MNAPVAEWCLAIPDRQFDEPKVSQIQKAKMLELGLPDSRLIANIGKWQASAVLDQLRARWLAAQKAKRIPQ